MASSRTCRTEARLNGFPEGRLPEMFGHTKADDPVAADRGQDEYRLLVAAEKYQTGFDQPLLCAMCVDKPLTGVAAVQTLSRLNRIHPLESQDDVRILDFVNQATDIAVAFEDWLETTITEPGDPNLLYSKQREVMDYQLLVASEMEASIRVLAPSADVVLDSSYHAGHAYAEIGEPDRALPQLRFSVHHAGAAGEEDADKVLGARFALAQMLAAAGRADDARAELESVRPLRPHRPPCAL